MARSFLFVPVLEERFIAKAAQRGADALILDLEASIDDSRKNAARATLPGLVERLSPDVAVGVRINPLWWPAVRDLQACVMPGVALLHLARCESAEHVRAVDALVGEMEAERGLPAGGIGMIAMLESAHSVAHATEIAGSSPRLVGLTLGVEDYAMTMGVSATADLLRPAAYQVNQAARAAGIDAFCVPASMSDFSNLKALEDAARYARALGATGGYAVHPAQLQVLNQVFQLTETEISWASAVVSGAEQAAKEGKGVFQVDGQMIDLPLIQRARKLLARQDFDR